MVRKPFAFRKLRGFLTGNYLDVINYDYVEVLITIIIKFHVIRITIIMIIIVIMIMMIIDTRRGEKRMSLDVRACNLPAIGLYKSLGFKVTYIYIYIYTYIYMYREGDMTI